MRHSNGIIRTKWDKVRKGIKIAQTLVNIEFALSHSSERAGIRTPDNLIKSQVL